MKKLMSLCLGVLCFSAAHAQREIKVEPQETADTLTYTTRTFVLTIQKSDVDDYLKTLDTVLKEKKYDHGVYRNIQFSPLKPQDVRTHYHLVNKFWNTSRSNTLAYDVARFTLFWAEDEGILMPYLDEIIPDLLQYGRIKVTEKGKLPAQKYQIFYEDIDGKTFRIYKSTTGKVIWKESEFFMEQFSAKR